MDRKRLQQLDEREAGWILTPPTLEEVVALQNQRNEMYATLSDDSRRVANLHRHDRAQFEAHPERGYRVEPLNEDLELAQWGRDYDRFVAHVDAAKAAYRRAASANLSAAQVAAILGVSTHRVAELARSRNVGTLITPRMRLFSAGDVEAMRDRVPGRPKKLAP